jgi:cell division protein FtsW
MIKRYHRPDFVLLLSIFSLLAIGLVMVFSASIVESQSAAGTNTYFFWRQLAAAVVGLVGFIITQKLDYHLWKHYAKWMFWGSVALLLVVLIPGVTPAGASAHRWIDVGIGTIQPTDIVKLTGLIYFATWLDDAMRDIGNFMKFVLPFFAYVGVLALLVMLEPDLGTLIVMTIIFVGQFWVAGGSFRHMAFFGAIAALGLLILIKFEPYRFNRVLVFLNPNADPLGIGYQINQALLAVGSGGFLGLGWGHSRQKHNYLPEASSDSIFAIVAEEMGFVRSVLLIGLYYLIMNRAMGVAKSAPDNYGRLLATGITLWFAFQTLINIGAIIAILPLTGVTLPLVSQGGTSMVMMLAALGILLNISKQTIDEAKALNVSGWWDSWTRYAYIGRELRNEKN